MLDGIAGGHFPPRPAERSLCAVCAYAAVCRKDYVTEETAAGEPGVAVVVEPSALEVESSAGNDVDG